MVRLLPVLLLAGCTATIQVNTVPRGADVYITDYPPMASEPPNVYVARGQGPMLGQVDYFAWDEFYLWVGAPGYQSHVQSVPGEAKVGPTIAGCFLLFPWVWAYGPSGLPMTIELEEAK